MDHEARLRAAYARMHQRLESQICIMGPDSATAADAAPNQSVGPNPAIVADAAASQSEGPDPATAADAAPHQSVGPNPATVADAAANQSVEAEEMFACSICFSTAIQPVLTTCGHLFCWPCLHTWLLGAPNPRCPVCRVQVDANGNNGFPIIPVFTTDGSARPAHADAGVQPSVIFAELNQATAAVLPQRPLPDRQNGRLPLRLRLRPLRLPPKTGPLFLAYRWEGHILALRELHQRAANYASRAGAEGRTMAPRERRDVAVGDLIVENMQLTEQILQSQVVRQRREINRICAERAAEIRGLRREHAAEMRRIREQHEEEMEELQLASAQASSNSSAEVALPRWTDKGKRVRR